MNDTMKKTFITVIGVLTVVAVLFINAKENTEGYEVGDTAKDFSLPNTEGEMISMKDYKDAKGFIVIFTCNTCPYAKMYEQRIIELDKQFASKGFPVIAINPNDVSKQPGDSMEEMKKRANNKKYTFPYLRDDEQKITAAYGATKTPHVYVLNKEKSDMYRVEYIGAIDNNPQDASSADEKFVEDAVNALLSGDKPKVKSSRAIGCTIKWKDA